MFLFEKAKLRIFSEIERKNLQFIENQNLKILFSIPNYLLLLQN